MEALLTTADVAARLNVNVDTVYSLVHRHDLPALRVGALWRFPEIEFERRVETRRYPRGAKSAMSQHRREVSTLLITHEKH